MKRAWLGLLLLFPCARAWSIPVQEVLEDTRGGLNKNHLPEHIAQNQVQDSADVRFDVKLGVTKRNGLNSEFSCTGTTATIALWSAFDSNGNEWAVRLDSQGSVTATKSSDCFTTTISTNFPSKTIATDFASGLGFFWFSNKRDGVSSWNPLTSSFVSYSTAPKAGSIAIFRNRVALGDIASELSSVRLSGELNGGDWSNDSRFSTSPVSFPIGGVNDGNRVFWVRNGQDELVIGKINSLFALYGNDQRDFQVRQISSQVGSRYPRGSSSFATEMRMLTNRGLESYQAPLTLQRISEPVQNVVEPITSGASSQKTLAFASAGAWASWTSVPPGNISTTLSPGDAEVANQTFTDNTAAGWTAGNLTFNGGALTTSGNSLATVIGPSNTSGAIRSRTFDALGSSPTWLKLDASTSATTTNATNKVTFFLQVSSASNSAVDDVSPYTDYWGTNQAPIASINTLNFHEQINNSSVTIESKQYIKYYSALTAIANEQTKLNSITLQDICTGYLQSGVLDFGTNISSFGLLSMSFSNNGGTITVQMQTTDTPTLDSTAWTTMTPNAVITLPVKRYGGLKLIFDSSATISVPIVHSISVNWTEGQGGPEPIVIPYQSRWYVFYSTSIGVNAQNDHLLIYDRNNSYTIYTDMNAGGAALFNNKLLIGDSRTMNGVYSVDVSTLGADVNSPYYPFVKFRRMDFQNPDKPKTLGKLYLTASREDATKSHIFSVDYFLDGGTTAYHAGNVEISTGIRMVDQKVPFPSDQPTQCNYLDVQVSEVSSNTPPWTISGIRVYATVPDEVP